MQLLQPFDTLSLFLRAFLCALLPRPLYTRGVPLLLREAV
jgi:hypothetical protein